MFAMIHNHNRNPREELLFNSAGSVQKTLYSPNPEATQDQIKNILLCNHSNLKRPSQCRSAFQSIQQKPDEALQTYNTRYESYYQLAHPGLTIDDDASEVSCIHTMPTPCMGNLVMRWRGGSTRSYQTTFRQPSKELSTLNQESSGSSRSTPEKSMRSTTLMSATVITTKRLRSMSHTSGT